MPRIPLMAANWKMHHTVASAYEFLESFRPMAKTAGEVDIAIAPPFTALHSMAQALTDSPIQLASQTVNAEPKGAFTGEIAANMLLELRCVYVIVGHSERRTLFGETDDAVNAKLKAVLAHHMIPILCVGESLSQRENGDTQAVLNRQVRAALRGVEAAHAAKSVIAYEPIWAIGTGKTATPEDAQIGCSFVRSVVADLFGTPVADAVRVQYGGSVKPENTQALMAQPDIDGALVGGASLDAESFGAIVQNARPNQG